MERVIVGGHFLDGPVFGPVCASVLCLLKQRQAGVAFGQTTNQVARTILTDIINHDQPKVLVGLGKDASDRSLYGGLGIVGCHDHDHPGAILNPDRSSGFGVASPEGPSLEIGPGRREPVESEEGLYAPCLLLSSSKRMIGVRQAQMQFAGTSVHLHGDQGLGEGIFRTALTDQGIDQDESRGGRELVGQLLGEPKVERPQAGVLTADDDTELEVALPVCRIINGKIPQMLDGLCHTPGPQTGTRQMMTGATPVRRIQTLQTIRVGDKAREGLEGGLCSVHLQHGPTEIEFEIRPSGGRAWVRRDELVVKPPELLEVLLIVEQPRDLPGKGRTRRTGQYFRNGVGIAGRNRGRRQDGRRLTGFLFFRRRACRLDRRGRRLKQALSQQNLPIKQGQFPDWIASAQGHCQGVPGNMKPDHLGPSAKCEQPARISQGQLRQGPALCRSHDAGAPSPVRGDQPALKRLRGTRPEPCLQGADRLVPDLDRTKGDGPATGRHLQTEVGLQRQGLIRPPTGEGPYVRASRKGINTMGEFSPWKELAVGSTRQDGNLLQGLCVRLTRKLQHHLEGEMGLMR